MYIQASATVLSPMFRWQGNGESSSSSPSCCDICAARNSFVLSVKEICSSVVNLCRHILPSIGLYPPIPVSQASLMDTDVGVLKMTELMEIPCCA